MLVAAYCPFDSLQPGANDFSEIGRDDHHEGDLGPQQLVDREALRYE
jgi:hypothetical protein